MYVSGSFRSSDHDRLVSVANGAIGDSCCITFSNGSGRSGAVESGPVRSRVERFSTAGSGARTNRSWAGGACTPTIPIDKCQTRGDPGTESHGTASAGGTAASRVAAWPGETAE